jgi:large subunit ribosomal protein L13
MTTTTTTQPYIIDAAGQKLGRVASEAARVLRGKDSADFQPYKVPTKKVQIVNAAQVLFDAERLAKEYFHHSGYMGGLKRISREKLIAEKGYAEVFKKAVYGMIPSNKLRKSIMKNLTITE